MDTVLETAASSPNVTCGLHSLGDSSDRERRRNPDSVDLLVTDDTAMGCQLLRDTLEGSRSPVKIVDCAVSQSAIFNSLWTHPCDVALISESLSDGPLSGFQALRELRRTFPKTRTIMLLKSNRKDLVLDAFRGGAKGIYCRTQPPNMLRKCILAVHQGQIWADSSQVETVLSAFASAAPLRILNKSGRTLLTKREEDVVRLVVEGFTNREIGLRLALTERTVSNYLFRTYEKLGISTRVELVLYSLKSTNH